MRIETTILSNLIHNEEYTRKVIPFIRSEYFTDYTEREIYKVISNYVEKYNNTPSIEAIDIDLQKTNQNEEQYKTLQNYIEQLQPSESEFNWLLDETEKWCKDRAIYNAIFSGIQIIDGKDKKKTPEAIPDILTKALAVSFDTQVGHDYIDQSTERYEFYHEVEEKIPFDLDFFNKITKGGMPNKTLNIVLAGTGVGKSLFMCHVAAASLMKNYNVLYITLEMAEKKIAERIDANLMNISLDDLHDLPARMFNDKFSRIQKKTQGKLIVKEYPTVQAGAGHFRHLVKELGMKRKFVPNVIFIDYINLCLSMVYRGANTNSYEKIKSIAEELRGLAVELVVPIITATQINRTGASSSDVSMENVAESFGLPATADLFLALIRTDELDELNEIMVKQLKNRYSDITKNRRFVLGIDRSKMRLFDCEEDAQEDLMQDDDLSVPRGTKKDFSDLIVN